MIKSSDIMTVTAVRTAMTSPTVPPQQKISRISNFSVASLLADTRQKSPQQSDIPTNLSQSSSSPISHHDSNSIAKNERHTPHSSTESEVDYDSNQEDSIVDIEDIHNENCSTPGLDKASHMLSTSTLGGHVPIRPTPFSALAAAAAAWGGIGAGMSWPGSRQMTPFGPSGLFPGQGFGPGHVPGGRFLITFLLLFLLDSLILCKKYFSYVYVCGLFNFSFILSCFVFQYSKSRSEL